MKITSFDDLMQHLAQTGSRIQNLEQAIAAAKDRLRFWQLAAGLGIGAAILLFLAWRRARQNLENCERQKRL